MFLKKTIGNGRLFLDKIVDLQKHARDYPRQHSRHT